MSYPLTTSLGLDFAHCQYSAEDFDEIIAHKNQLVQMSDIDRSRSPDKKSFSKAGKQSSLSRSFGRSLGSIGRSLSSQKFKNPMEAKIYLFMEKVSTLWKAATTECSLLERKIVVLSNLNHNIASFHEHLVKMHPGVVDLPPSIVEFQQWEQKFSEQAQLLSLEERIGKYRSLFERENPSQQDIVLWQHTMEEARKQKGRESKKEEGEPAPISKETLPSLICQDIAKLRQGSFQPEKFLDHCLTILSAETPITNLRATIGALPHHEVGCLRALVQLLSFLTAEASADDQKALIRSFVLLLCPQEQQKNANQLFAFLVAQYIPVFERTTIFGKSLEEICFVEGGTVPSFVREAIAYLDAYPSQKLYCRPPLKSRKAEFILCIEEGATVERAIQHVYRKENSTMRESNGPFLVAMALLDFLKSVKGGLIPPHLYAEHLEKEKTHPDKIAGEILSSIKGVQQSTLNAILNHFVNLFSDEDHFTTFLPHFAKMVFASLFPIINDEKPKAFAQKQPRTATLVVSLVTRYKNIMTKDTYKEW